jgi:hypothetical protein
MDELVDHSMKEKEKNGLNNSTIFSGERQLR